MVRGFIQWISTGPTGRCFFELELLLGWFPRLRFLAPNMHAFAPRNWCANLLVNINKDAKRNEDQDDRTGQPNWHRSEGWTIMLTRQRLDLVAQDLSKNIVIASAQSGETKPHTANTSGANTTTPSFSLCVRRRPPKKKERDESTVKCCEHLRRLDAYAWIFLSPICSAFSWETVLSGKVIICLYVFLEAIFLSVVFWMYATNWRRFSPIQRRLLAIQRRFLMETTKIYVVTAKSGNSPLRVSRCGVWVSRCF